MKITTVGLDIAKRVFQLHGVDAAGKAVLRRNLQRSEVLAFFKALPSCLVGIEACGTAHYWAREIRELGHEVRLMPPSYVAPWLTKRRGSYGLCWCVEKPIACRQQSQVAQPEAEGTPISGSTADGVMRAMVA